MKTTIFYTAQEEIKAGDTVTVDPKSGLLRKALANDCTPIESPEEKCLKIRMNDILDNQRLSNNPMKCLEVAECKAPCEEEKGGWGKKLVEKLPTRCFVGLSENEAETTMALVDNFLRSELATAREEERTRIEKALMRGWDKIESDAEVQMFDNDNDWRNFKFVRNKTRDILSALAIETN